MYAALTTACSADEPAHAIARARRARLRMDAVEGWQGRSTRCKIATSPRWTSATSPTRAPTTSATDALVVARACTGDWAAALAAADRAKSLRARYRAAVSTGAVAEQLLEIEQLLYAASRGVPTHEASDEDFRVDALARAIPPDQRLGRPTGGRVRGWRPECSKTPAPSG